MSTIISNAWICSISNRTIKPVFGNLIIEKGKIKSIQKVDFNKYLNNSGNKIDNSFNAGGRVITIPNVNFHEHIYSRLSKGLQVSGAADSFYNILDSLWWKLDRSLNLKMIEASAKMAVIESISNGVTYIFDHHSSPLYSKESLKQIADVVQQHNLRGVFCFETTDRNGEEFSINSLNENIRFFENETGGNIKSMFGLHASFTLEDTTLKKVSDYISKNDIGIHIHLCEDAADRVLSRKKFGKLPLQRLIDYKLLNSKSILSHAIHLTKDEYNKILKYGSAVAFNPESNLNNSVGINNFKMIPNKLPILCGTDGMHANPAKSLKLIFLLMRHSGFSFEDTFNRIINIYFSQIDFVKQYFPDFSTLNENDRADFIIHDYIPPTPFGENNFWGHYIYGMLDSQIHSVVQNGKFLMKEKKLIGIDEPEVYKDILVVGKKLFQQFKKTEKADREKS